MGSAAASQAYCNDAARPALESLLAAHQRGMLAFEHGYHHGHGDSLVAARAALWQAIDGRDDVVLAYIGRYLKNSRLLAEGLKAIAAAGEERPDAAKEHVGYGHKSWIAFSMPRRRIRECSRNPPGGITPRQTLFPNLSRLALLHDRNVWRAVPMAQPTNLVASKLSDGSRRSRAHA